MLRNFQPVEPSALTTLQAYLLSDIANLRPFPWYFLKHFSVDRQTGCWNWRGNKATNPRYPWHQYGQYTINPKLSDDGRKHTVCAHKYAYERTFGPVLPSLELDHTCENKLCVNPEHLEPVTRSVNMLRFFARRKVGAR